MKMFVMTSKSVVSQRTKSHTKTNGLQKAADSRPFIQFFFEAYNKLQTFPLFYMYTYRPRLAATCIIYKCHTRRELGSAARSIVSNFGIIGILDFKSGQLQSLKEAT